VEMQIHADCKGKVAAESAVKHQATNHSHGITMLHKKCLCFFSSSLRPLYAPTLCVC